MSAGIVVSNVWSMSGDYENASEDDAPKARGGFDEETSEPALGVLLVSADDPSKRVYACDLCGKEYTWMCSLRRHQLQCGNKEARNKCEFCKKKFFRRDRLREHLLTHHANLAFECDTWLAKVLHEKK